MDSIAFWDNVGISIRARKILQKLLAENPVLENIIRNADNVVEVHAALRNWVMPILKRNPAAESYYLNKSTDPEPEEKLSWQDLAAIRILDYIDNAGKEFPDQNIGGQLAQTNPFKMLWLATHKGSSGAEAAFFEDMLQLFRQLNDTQIRTHPTKSQVENWMKKYPSGLDPVVEELRQDNKKRIIRILIEKIDSGDISSRRYSFESGLSFANKEKLMNEWWLDSNFHLRFAIRSPELLNEMLDYTLTEETMKVLKKARRKGIPFFVNPYYLSLLNSYIPDYVVGADMAIRSYVIYSKQLVEEFGKIVAWEKEDKVKPGEPNAAGWIVPSYNIHRRYPEVAIFIPDTVGRACGGLCASCQRMYDFQSGRYNFNLDKLKPKRTWEERLPELLGYFRNDAQLRDILITGGDALMSSNRSLKQILDAIYKMALAKIEDNSLRAEGEKYAEIVRIRIGTRLPAYLPQRITPNLGKVLSEFKKKAQKAGIKQFVVQTHFQSPMEITFDSKRAVQLLLESGWAVTNQEVFTTAASRRGHSAKLRNVLNELGVLSYYTFAVKGFKENKTSFTPNSRLMQERMEEKIFGTIPKKDMDFAQHLLLHPQKIVESIKSLHKEAELPFLSTDRSILNLPGVGKSMTFRTIGITRYGRRILEFEHDPTRTHSPIIHKMGKVIVIESKSLDEYLKQLEEMGENPEDYAGVFGYTIGHTEPRMAMYEYPEYDYQITKEITNLEI
ncbi:KamA family radical SAM protein [Draconibacterium halophilum]|uniref:KamA family protein n=1 Tax=Draconibacterium halophilum TaxID=2706887 RepID=A0A6C0RAD7_9BACT|nr:KamA family protein [Draconibacterium halophilum]QIA06932.1 KamA family protein [Draconibacterium halophilum]